jgi:hypothetical protein
MMSPETARALAMFSSGYVKRLLESGYDWAMAGSLGHRARQMDPAYRYGIEASLYALMAFADLVMPARSALGRLVKDTLLDMPPEIAKRFVNGVRSESDRLRKSPGVPEEHRIALQTLYAMDDAAVVAVSQWANVAVATHRADETVQQTADHVLEYEMPQASAAVVPADPLLDTLKGINKKLVQLRQRVRKGGAA